MNKNVEANQAQSNANKRLCAALVNTGPWPLVNGL